MDNLKEVKLSDVSWFHLLYTDERENLVEKHKRQEATLIVTDISNWWKQRITLENDFKPCLGPFIFVLIYVWIRSRHADQLYVVMLLVYHNIDVYFQQCNSFCHIADITQDWLEEHERQVILLSCLLKLPYLEYNEFVGWGWESHHASKSIALQTQRIENVIYQAFENVLYNKFHEELLLYLILKMAREIINWPYKGLYT